MVENFRDEPVSVTLESSAPMKASIRLVLPQDEVIGSDFSANKLEFSSIPARSLVAVGYTMK